MRHRKLIIYLMLLPPLAIFAYQAEKLGGGMVVDRVIIAEALVGVVFLVAGLNYLRKAKAAERRIS